MRTLYHPGLARNILKHNTIDKRKLHKELTKAHKTKACGAIRSTDLWVAMIWYDTPQGYEFWGRLGRNLPW